MANIQKKFKDAKDVFDAGQENSLLDKGLSLLVPAILGFSVAHSVWGIANERDYAVTQCVVSVAGLGYCLKKRYEVEHKKTGKILNQIFSEQNAHLGWGSFWFVDAKSPVVEKSNGERGRLAFDYRFSMDEWGPVVDELKRVMWKNIIEFALYNNIERGMGLKEGVLSAVHFIVNDAIDERLSKNVIRQCIEKDRFDNVLKLKMCQEVYQAVENCACDEDVLSFLKKGITNQNSLFKDIAFCERVNVFFNRAPYEEGKKKIINAMSVGEYASMASLAGVATFTGVNGVGLGLGFLTAGFLLAKMHFSNQHLRLQRARYQNLVGGLKSIEPIERFELKGRPVWRQIETSLTKVQAAKLVKAVYEDVLSFLEKDQNLSCEKAADCVNMYKILMNPALKNALDLLEKGLTLEQTIQKCGLETVHKMMMYDTVVGILKNMKGYAVRTFIFELKMSEMNQDSALSLAENEMKLTVGKRLRYIDNLFKNGYISMEEKERRIRNMFIEDRKIKTICVSKNMKLPKMIERIKQGSNQLN